MIMKRLLFSGLCLFMALLSAGAQERSAKMAFEGYTHDFGTIRETDGDVNHVFRFRNEGTLPLVINSVGVSCGCTTPRFSKEPVMPGKAGEIAVTFDPMNRPGMFEKVIQVMCNDLRRNIQLTITGNVVPRPRTVQDDFPYYIQDGLRIADKNFAYGALPRGRVTVRSIGMANAGKVPVTVGIDGSRLPLYLTVKPKKAMLAPGERSEIVVTFDATKQPDLWGKRSFTFPLLTNGKGAQEGVNVVAVFTEDFSGMSGVALQRAPRADFSSFFYHFSDQPQGKVLSREFQISNSGETDLIIRHLGPTSDRVKAVADKMVVRPGDTATLTVTVDTRGGAWRLAEGVNVVTNDPARPSHDIRVMATVVK